MGMVDVSEKPVVVRKAQAGGKIFLSPKTLEEIKAGRIKKGNPLQVAEVAAMNAAKQTHLLIPHCHQIPLDTVRVDFDVRRRQHRGCLLRQRPGANRGGDGSACRRLCGTQHPLGYGEVSGKR